ncbi:LysM peptidoglycan-binding domain-containing protein [Polymorphobacter sp.]|uniref:LysM peptidoglycan-binding domain-containing protein n=1 Tax=Polymorphobacter sp. TaxID=1909290 RepID=UPI003F72B01A
MLTLTLPFAAPATAPVPSEARWDSAPALRYRIEAGDTLASIASRGLGNPQALPMLAAANDLPIDARLRAGQFISIPSNMLRREPIRATVTGFAGDVRLSPDLPVAVGDTLGEGDIIEVGADSFVRLDMRAAGCVTLPSQSRVRIRTLHRVALTGEIARALEDLPMDHVWLAPSLVRSFDSDSGGA